MKKKRFHDYDAANRFKDAIWLHQSMQGTDAILAGRFMAVSLTDGTSDGVAYDTRNEAVNKQRSNMDGNRVLYFQIPLEKLGVAECDSLLWYARRAYDAGYRPVGVHERSGGALHIPTAREHLAGRPQPTNEWRPLLGPDGRPIDDHRR